MFCIYICLSEPVGADILWVGPKPIFFTRSRSRKKSGAGAEEKWLGSATLGGTAYYCRFPSDKGVLDF